jgi:resuscitation-promoting factor RpfA
MQIKSLVRRGAVAAMLVAAVAGCRPGRFGSNTVWDKLAMCESSGQWRINTGNGFFGGLQFHPDTWTGFGGGAFAPRADLATREQQIIVAERVLAKQGWGAWPACSRKLGLR